VSYSWTPKAREQMPSKLSYEPTKQHDASYQKRAILKVSYH
jgi:hypothetical protein